MFVKIQLKTGHSAHVGSLYFFFFWWANGASTSKVCFNIKFESGYYYITQKKKILSRPYSFCFNVFCFKLFNVDVKQDVPILQDTYNLLFCFIICVYNCTTN